MDIEIILNVGTHDDLLPIHIHNSFDAAVSSPNPTLPPAQWLIQEVERRIFLNSESKTPAPTNTYKASSFPRPPKLKHRFSPFPHKFPVSGKPGYHLKGAERSIIHTNMRNFLPSGCTYANSNSYIDTPSTVASVAVAPPPPPVHLPRAGQAAPPEPLVKKDVEQQQPESFLLFTWTKASRTPTPTPNTNMTQAHVQTYHPKEEQEGLGLGCHRIQRPSQIQVPARQHRKFARRRSMFSGLAEL
ncbi:hypothetical protein CVT25_000541 [Psilocybe cyanescens]|uniref:Uncharacterized protein n=1 Tax=Psilocybe cyanescens TaxID=93625 RepID=A0A409WZP5_PSICY|nr:hypothetical protein CVT25_000541 [Psilocybe cyanescens]